MLVQLRLSDQVYVWHSPAASPAWKSLFKILRAESVMPLPPTFVPTRCERYAKLSRTSPGTTRGGRMEEMGLL